MIMAPPPRAHERLAALRRHTEPTSAFAATTSVQPPQPPPVRPRLPRCSGPADLTPSAHLPTLEADDVAFFKEHGFLIKKRLLDPIKTQQAMSRIWDVLEGKALPVVPGITGEQYQHSISPGIRRDDPATWAGASANYDGKHPGGLRSLGHLDWLRELIPYDKNVRAIATAMLGPLRETRRV